MWCDGRRDARMNACQRSACQRKHHNFCQLQRGQVCVRIRLLKTMQNFTYHKRKLNVDQTESATEREKKKGMEGEKEPNKLTEEYEKCT